MDSSLKELVLMLAKILLQTKKKENLMSLPLPSFYYRCKTIKSDKINTTAPATRPASVQAFFQLPANPQTSFWEST